MITTEQIKSDLRNMLSEIVEDDVNCINDDDNLLDDLGYPSVTVIQLFVSCQEKYNINMQENVNLKNDVTLANIAALISEKLAAQGAEADAQEYGEIHSDGIGEGE